MNAAVMLAIADRYARSWRVVSALNVAPVDSDVVIPTADPRIGWAWPEAPITAEAIRLFELSTREENEEAVPCRSEIKILVYGKKRLAAARTGDALVRETNAKPFFTLAPSVGRILFQKIVGQGPESLDQVTRLFEVELSLSLTYQLDY